MAAHVTEGGELCIGGRSVLGGVMGEDGDAVEWTVVLRVVQPALQSVGAVPPDANPHDVGGAAKLKQPISCMLLNRSSRAPH